MKRFIKLMFCVAVFGITAYLAQPKEETSELLLENVEALTDNEYKLDGYFVMHLPCFNQYGISTGEHTATSYQGTEDNPGPCTVPHSHNCQKCSSPC